MASNGKKWPSKRFKCSDLEKYTNRVLRVVLVDIMKPKVALEYLTDNQIEHIQTIGVSKWKKVQIILDDHCYFTKRNTVVRQGIRQGATKLSARSNHRANMTTFEQSNTPGFNDASSIDSIDVWNTSIQWDDGDDDADDDDNNNSLLYAENCSQYSQTESNTSTPYRMSESDLRKIYDRDNEMAANADDAHSLDSYSDEYDDGNHMNDAFDTNGECCGGGVDGDEPFENDDDDFGDFESIITQLTNKNGPQNTDEHGKSWRSAEKVFNNICLKHLRNKCNELLCQFGHNLPETVNVARNLQRADVTDVEEAHQLLMVYEKLLVKYWPTFCSFYGRVIWRENLRLSIGALSLMEGLCIEYNLLSHILDGFMKTGMNYALCVQQIMLELDESLGPEEQFYLVWPIIMDPRNSAIKSHVEHFSDVMLKDLSSLNVKAIQEMLSIQIASESIDIRALTVNILKRCIIAIFQSIDPAVLTEYILYLRAFDESASKAIQQRANLLTRKMR